MRNTRSLLVLLAASLLLVACLDPSAPGNLVPGTVDDDPTLPRVEANGTVFHAEAFGDPDAPILLTIHGGPGADYRSMLNLQALADEGYYVVFWDQRGSGLSRRHDADDYKWHTMNDDLAAIIEAFTSRPDQPIVFIGHSWGAMYATWFLNDWGDLDGRIRGAVLSEPGGFTDRQLERFFEEMFGSVEFTSEWTNDAMWMQQNLTGDDHARADYLAASMFPGSAPSEQNDPDNPAPSWRDGAVINQTLPDMAFDRGFDWTTNLDAFVTPVLFLRGELNTVATLEHQQELAAEYPNAEVVTIPGVGHEMIWETPEPYLQHVREYLDLIGFHGGAR